MIYLDWVGVSEITDVGFVYTSPGDDTPATLEVPAHSAGDLVLVFARGTVGQAPAAGVALNSVGTNIGALTTISAQTPAIEVGFRLSYIIAPAGLHAVQFTFANQIGIHVYRGATSIGDVAVTTGTLDNFGANLPALSLQDTGGKSRVWSGVNFNQVKSSVSVPAGLTKRLTSPDALGSGTAVTMDSAGVASFAGGFVSAFGGAYYSAWSVEMKT